VKILSWSLSPPYTRTSGGAAAAAGAAGVEKLARSEGLMRKSDLQEEESILCFNTKHAAHISVLAMNKSIYIR
jgi:hypothetical protein